MGFVEDFHYSLYNLWDYIFCPIWNLLYKNRNLKTIFSKKILYSPLMGCSTFSNYHFQMGVTVMGFAEHFVQWLHLFAFVLLCQHSLLTITYLSRRLAKPVCSALLWGKLRYCATENMSDCVRARHHAGVLESFWNWVGRLNPFIILTFDVILPLLFQKIDCKWAPGNKNIWNVKK